jgi:hypothetical protein
MKIRIFNINYDTDGQKIQLPKEIIFDQISANTDINSEIADMISDKTGFCVNSFSLEIIKN